ncbi:MAG: hypothetical protein WB586_00115 [Chthoniobacterales bacterium]
MNSNPRPIKVPPSIKARVRKILKSKATKAERKQMLDALYKADPSVEHRLQVCEALRQFINELIREKEKEQ